MPESSEQAVLRRVFKRRADDGIYEPVRAVSRVVPNQPVVLTQAVQHGGGNGGAAGSALRAVHNQQVDFFPTAQNERADCLRLLRRNQTCRRSAPSASSKQSRRTRGAGYRSEQSRL